MKPFKILTGLALGATLTGASLVPQIAQAHGGKHQDFTVTVDSKGYHPASVKVAAGKEVNLTFVSKEASCANGISIPSLKRTLSLQPGKKKMVAFMPKKGQTIAFACSMNMFKGKVVAK
jgi:plastocyanin domain-containing protein